MERENFWLGATCYWRHNLHCQRGWHHSRVVGGVCTSEAFGAAGDKRSLKGGEVFWGRCARCIVWCECPVSWGIRAHFGIIKCFACQTCFGAGPETKRWKRVKEFSAADLHILLSSRVEKSYVVLNMHHDREATQHAGKMCEHRGGCTSYRRPLQHSMIR